ncbi:hypothetical protein R3P38DRAFT_2535195 [Favolaschia claudopus]|uniref:F-box domain-containing protein n=1 Tax=Favolaschia claudopus TaxID=2862362 RepID=A0AAW0B2L0_9AGAR
MHDCLTIPEILQIIVENLRLPSGSKDRRALAILARTSRAFSALVLDELWKDLSEAEAILCCMPLDLFSGRGKDRKLLRPMKTSDWDRPRGYLSRVKHFTLWSHGDCDAIADILPALNASLPAGKVEFYFPSMTALDWRNEYELPHMRFLLSARLTELSLRFPSSDTNFSFLSSIPLVCPGLKELDVTSPLPDGPSISELIRGLHSLQKLRIPVPDLASLEHISRQKGLTSLECSLLNTLPILRSPLSFNALEEVTFRHTNLETIINLLSRCSLSVLKRLEISPSSSTTTTCANKLHKTLSESCTPSSLTALKLYFSAGGVAEGHPEMYTIPFHCFEPLFCFRLTSIVISSMSGIRLNDEEMEIIARTWPCIQHLTLLERVECQTLSLRSLVILAKHCPSLETLALSLNTRSIPELATSNGCQLISQLALYKLEIGRSPVFAPVIHTTRFLSSIFPNLSAVNTEVDEWGLYDEDEDPDSELKLYDGLWKEVESQLSIFKAVRDEERARVLAELKPTGKA